ncbi:MAG: AAA family ATPase [Rickettsiales bacterium]
MEQQNNNKPNFFAFAQDSADRAAIKAFTDGQGWDDSCVMQGDITTASQYLKTNPSPALLLVEIPSAQEAPALLDELANACDAQTKVIIIGTINEYSFYCWLVDIGVFSYLLRPLTKDVLEATYKKSIEQNEPVKTTEKEPTKIIATIGARGGVGASTIAMNLAGIFAEYGNKKIALVDIDPYTGTVSLTQDLEPARGLRDALEKPDRIDPLFIDQVMSNPYKNLWVLSAEEPLKESIEISDSTAEALIHELSNKYDVVVLDIPRNMGKFEHECLKRAHHVLLVAELSLASLRDTLRLSDLIVDTFKMPPPMVIANRVGVAPKNEMSVADFEKGITAKIAEKIMYSPDIFMYIGNDIPSIAHAKNAILKPLYSLAKQLVPSITLDEAPKDKNLLGFMKKKKKE